MCSNVFDTPKRYRDYDGCPKCGGGYYERATKTMTKEELKQYLSLKRENSKLEDRLLTLKNQDKITELTEIYENNKIRCMTLMLRTEQFIASIDDSLTRQIFDARYIKGLSWAGVATHLGGYASEDTLRMRHDRYLEKIRARAYI